jgi:hypothetical protein
VKGRGGKRRIVEQRRSEENKAVRGDCDGEWHELIYKPESIAI